MLHNSVSRSRPRTAETTLPPTHVSTLKRPKLRACAVPKLKEYNARPPVDIAYVDTLDIRPFPVVVLKLFAARAKWLYFNNLLVAGSSISNSVERRPHPDPLPWGEGIYRRHLRSIPRLDEVGDALGNHHCGDVGVGAHYVRHY